MPQLVLASSSPYRKMLLERLALPFTCASPDIDEQADAEEGPRQLVERLSQQKAEAVARDYPTHTVIASDQVAALDDRILTKPGKLSRAIEQLTACSGRCVTFYTGLYLHHPGQPPQTTVTTTDVVFRTLTRSRIERYLEKEQPFDCAGSFKCEGLGITLFSQIHSDDPTALIGLPLIALTSMLNRIGIDPLKP